MSPEAIKNFLVATVLPLVVGAVTTWLFASVHVFSLFGIAEKTVAGDLTQLGAFAIGTGLTWLFAHFHLSGVYTPGAKALKAGVAPPVAPIRTRLGETRDSQK